MPANIDKLPINVSGRSPQPTRARGEWLTWALLCTAAIIVGGIFLDGLIHVTRYVFHYPLAALAVLGMVACVGWGIGEALAS